jgi:hypothetical protein
MTVRLAHEIVAHHTNAQRVHGSALSHLKLVDHDSSSYQYAERLSDKSGKCAQELGRTRAGVDTMVERRR